VNTAVSYSVVLDCVQQQIGYNRQNHFLTQLNPTHSRLRILDLTQPDQPIRNWTTHGLLHKSDMDMGWVQTWVDLVGLGPTFLI